MTDGSDAAAVPRRSDGLLLLAAVFAIAICGLVYELVAGALSSYLLGNSVTQFSLVIGLFLSAMGLGSFLSRYVTGDLLARFVAVEIAVGVIGGSTALVGFATFAYTAAYQFVLLGLVVVVGVLIGLEVPLLVRILRGGHPLRVSLADVLSADYAGALAASVLFPFFLLPELGLIRAGLVMGLLNVVVAGVVIRRFRGRLGPWRRGLQVAAVLATLGLAVAVALAGGWVRFLESRLYQDEVILARDSAYQRIVLTRWRDDVRLYLDGHLQFSSVDEYRYHEALVHPAMGLAARRERVLILGGGDGLAAREVARYEDVQRIDLVDLDPGVTTLFANRPLLRDLNGGIYDDARLRVHHVDAMRFLENSTTLYDVIVMDLPDPADTGVAKLYSRAFFNLAGRHLAEGGLLATQCTSPFRSREAFWCIVRTLDGARCGPSREGRFEAVPYHTVVPTFGTWGFVLAGARRPDLRAFRPDLPLRYLTADVVAAMTVFPPDIAEVTVPISRLDDPVVMRLYHDGYHEYLE